ncbi:MAG: sugar ABC transporter ATP-binding protein [Candidatus Solibacter sp.]|nr:sugar ABC transporter ATP-binding protein [Candidatus Solibacter sp.]
MCGGVCWTFPQMVLRLTGMQKRFGGVQALVKGDLEVCAGEVHLLLGENGAGKSTLVKIAAGMIRPDGGEIVWQGRRVLFRNPAEAQRAGIAMVHQESLLAQHLTVAENVWLGREPSNGWGVLRRGAIESATRRLIEEHGFPLRPEWRVDRLGPAGRQLVEICRAVAHQANLLIFDEPTSALSDRESSEVLRIVRDLKLRGLAVIYITHRMSELRAAGDRATVLRDGSTVFTAPMKEAGDDELIRHMAGREAEGVFTRTPLPPGKELLRVEGLSRRGVLEDINLSVRAGEIVGIAGLMGSGRTELCRALFGAEPAGAGRILVDGRPVQIDTPRKAVEAGIALAPEDRQSHGLAAGRPVGENITLPSIERFSPGGVIDLGRERAETNWIAGRLRLKASSLDQEAGRLSGGNQQKAVIAKWVMRGARVFLFDEPSRGIDIGAKREVFEMMDELARQGAAVLMVSSEMQELTGIADRILVMKDGRIAAELPRHASQEQILSAATMGGAV